MPITPQPMRRMRVYAPEGYIGVDFAKRHLVLVQPSDQLRRHGLDPRLLTPAGMPRLKEELFERHLQACELACNQGDQLTCELRHFVQCVQTGTQPRVSGTDGPPIRASSAASSTCCST